MSEQKSRVTAAEVAFFANKAYFDACEAIRGCVDATQVDFDAYAYLDIDAVPDTIHFGSASKRFRSGRARLNEFRKYIYFHMPDGLNGLESKEAESEGLSAACAVLREYGIECDIRWSYHG